MVINSIHNAYRVLKVAYHFGTRAGGTLLIAQIHARSSKAGWGTTYIADGLSYALDQKWLEVTPDGTFQLTQKGFDEMMHQR